MNAEITLVGNDFVQRFSATRRGARLARRLAV
ncbi:ATP-binding protein, partial [Streptomyces sp. SID7803]|nr:ATP-binding protein [Streptomyces sp. SID7803]